MVGFVKQDGPRPDDTDNKIKLARVARPILSLLREILVKLNGGGGVAISNIKDKPTEKSRKLISFVSPKRSSADALQRDFLTSIDRSFQIKMLKLA